jgi:hypothetical protein
VSVLTVGWERAAELIAEQVAAGRKPAGRGLPCRRCPVYPQLERDRTPADRVLLLVGQPQPVALVDYRHPWHIDDLEFLSAVRKASADTARASYWNVAAALAGQPQTDRGPASVPGVPYRVVLAKARRLIARGMVVGCWCGCDGDFELTAAGAAAVDRRL